MAAKNVLLIDAVFQSGLDSTAVHSKDLKKSIDFLIYYSSFEENLDQNSYHFIFIVTYELAQRAIVLYYTKLERLAWNNIIVLGLNYN